MKIRQNKSGFTLIEVVLVLAIGALIFLLAFLAFRQVTSNRRDTQRRKDADRIIAEIQNFKVDKKGASQVLLTEARTSSADNDGICSPSSNAANVLTKVVYDFTTENMCKSGKFYSPSGSNYTTVAWDSTATLTRDQVRIRTSFTLFGDILAPSCDGSSNLPIGGIRVEIGLEKGVACREFVQ